MEALGVQFWNNMLAQPKEANTTQELVHFYETVQGCTAQVEATLNSEFTPECGVMHQAKRVISAVFISHKRETERVESSLTVLVTSQYNA